MLLHRLEDPGHLLPVLLECGAWRSIGLLCRDHTDADTRKEVSRSVVVTHSLLIVPPAVDGIRRQKESGVQFVDPCIRIGGVVARTAAAVSSAQVASPDETSTLSCMDARPDDLDTTRSVIAAHDLTATASGYLTTDVAMGLPFEALVPFKTALKRFFSKEAWTEGDADALSELIVPHLSTGWWEHDLGGGISLTYGIRDGRFELWVSGSSTPAVSVFDRVFDGPVVPEATPHPRKVKFSTGGTPAPGVWYRRSDPQPDDARVQRMFAEPYVTDVMVAGDFVTVGIGAREPWEQRLEPLLALVTELFADEDAGQAAPQRTRDELLAEARSKSGRRPEELHLLDPDDPDDRRRLAEAIDDPDVRVRRVAVAVLLESANGDVRREAAARGVADPSRVVRRTAIDAAADTGEEHFRALFEAALDDDDAWIRWKAVRSLGELGVTASRGQIEALANDPDFQVRFEVAKVLH